MTALLRFRRKAAGSLYGEVVAISCPRSSCQGRRHSWESALKLFRDVAGDPLIRGSMHDDRNEELESGAGGGRVK